MIVTTTNRTLAPAGTVLHVIGDVDTWASDGLREHLHRFDAEPDGAVVVDLSDVTFMSCTALAVLAAARESLGSRLLLGGRSRVVSRLLDITGLSSYFPSPAEGGAPEPPPEQGAGGTTNGAVGSGAIQSGTWTFNRSDVRRVRDRLVAVHGCDDEQAWRMLAHAAACHSVPVGELVELLLGTAPRTDPEPSRNASVAALALLMRAPAEDGHVVRPTSP